MTHVDLTVSVRKNTNQGKILFVLETPSNGAGHEESKGNINGQEIYFVGLESRISNWKGA